MGKAAELQVNEVSHLSLELHVYNAILTTFTSRLSINAERRLNIPSESFWLSIQFSIENVFRVFITLNTLNLRTFVNIVNCQRLYYRL